MHISTKNKIKHFGFMRFCPVCRSHLRRFHPAGLAFRPNAMCPVCHAMERHRLLWLYLHNETTVFTDNLRMLHTAPENCFVRRFRRIPNLNYVTVDIKPQRADLQMDITAMSLHADSLDIIYSSHVLEHIPDDRSAISEFFRILKPGGRAIIMVPVGKGATVEDLTLTDPQQRQKRFGHPDHVRRYGDDFTERLKAPGFQVSEIHYAGRFTKWKRKYMGLGQDSIYLCIKPE